MQTSFYLKWKMNILLLECDQLSVMMIINKHCKNTVEFALVILFSSLLLTI